MRTEISLPRRGCIHQPRVSEAQPWVGREIHPKTLKGFHKIQPPKVAVLHGIEANRDVVLVEPFQGSRSMSTLTQGCASLTLGCWMQPLRGKDRRSPETRRNAAEPGGCTRTRARYESAATAPWPLLTTAARGAERAPVSHRPFCGSGDLRMSRRGRYKELKGPVKCSEY